MYITQVMDQRINSAVYVEVLFKVNPWISHRVLALVRKWETAQGKE